MKIKIILSFLLVKGRQYFGWPGSRKYIIRTSFLGSCCLPKHVIGQLHSEYQACKGYSCLLGTLGHLGSPRTAWHPWWLPWVLLGLSWAGSTSCFPNPQFCCPPHGLLVSSSWCCGEAKDVLMMTRGTNLSPRWDFVSGSHCRVICPPRLLATPVCGHSLGSALDR